MSTILLIFDMVVGEQKANRLLLNEFRIITGIICAFQASTVMAAMEMIGVNHFAGIIGVSYGGFVGYRIAAMYPDAVDRLVLICAGVCIEESDLGAGLFVVSDLSEAASLLVARTPEKLMQLMRLTHHKPPRGIPSCFLADYIDVSVAVRLFLLALGSLAHFELILACLSQLHAP